MADKTWKAAERKVAARIGGARLSNHALGLRTPDCESDWLSVEVKHRKALPSWLLDALGQARTNATPGKLAVAVLHQAGARYDDALVVVRLSDFVEWFGGDGTADGDDAA
jgi:hypothetical protein